MLVSPRKLPRQARAKATVDAIVEATAQVLLAEGYEGFTTARAAERAGVSIGSLYQYFPNKAALVSAVVDRSCAEFLAAFDRAVTHQPSLSACIHALVDFAFDSKHIAPELHRLLNEVIPKIGVTERTRSVSAETVQAIEAMLRQHQNEIAAAIDIAAAARVIQTSLEALAHETIRTDANAAGKEAIAIETTRMLCRYLGIDE
jgi:AcrR family transcriptional regulator